MKDGLSIFIALVLPVNCLCRSYVHLFFNAIHQVILSSAHVSATFIISPTLKSMGFNEFYSNAFVPRDGRQQQLVEDFRRLRALLGMPHRIAYLRSLAKTRKNVRSVYPPGWKYM